MKPTEILREEHRTIERMLVVLKRAADRLETGEKVDGAVFEQAVDFIRNFADRYHHAKEEDSLFKAMEAQGIPRQGGPIGVMLLDHEEGRDHVRGMAEALKSYPKGEGAASRELVAHARGYADLLAAHIFKEDNILYPMGDQVLPDADQARMLEEFTVLEQRVLTPSDRQRYMELLSRLEKAV